MNNVGFVTGDYTLYSMTQTTTLGVWRHNMKWLTRMTPYIVMARVDRISSTSRVCILAERSTRSVSRGKSPTPAEHQSKSSWPRYAAYIRDRDLATQRSRANVYRRRRRRGYRKTAQLLLHVRQSKPVGRPIDRFISRGDKNRATVRRRRQHLLLSAAYAVDVATSAAPASRVSIWNNTPVAAAEWCQAGAPARHCLPACLSDT